MNLTAEQRKATTPATTNAAAPLSGLPATIRAETDESGCSAFRTPINDFRTISAIDPGPAESAIVQWTGKGLIYAGIHPNDYVLRQLREGCFDGLWAVEMVACYGMPVGKEVFETCLMIGRIQEIASNRCLDCRLVTRHQVKIHHCHSARAKDSNIRQALVDKYGEPGTKKDPGKTYGLKSHLWSAFAVATFVSETEFKEAAK
jgi:hypothetical protein